MTVKKNILYFVSILIFLCLVSYTGSFIISAFFASQEINIILKVILVALAAIIIGACYIIGSAAQEWDLVQDFYAEGKKLRSWEIIAVICMMVFSICISIIFYGVQVQITSIVSVIFAVFMIPAVYIAGRAAQDMITGALAAVFCMAIPVGAISGQEGFIFESGDGFIASCENGFRSIKDGGIFINVLTRLENITNFNSSFPKLIMCIFFFFSIWAGLFLFVSRKNGGVFLTTYFNIVIVLQVLFDISNYFFLLVYPAAALTAAMGISFFVHKWIFDENWEDKEGYDEETESSFEKFSIVKEEDAEEEMKKVNAKKQPEQSEKEPMEELKKEQIIEKPEISPMEQEKTTDIQKQEENKEFLEELIESKEESLEKEMEERKEESLEEEMEELEEELLEPKEEILEEKMEELKESVEVKEESENFVESEELLEKEEKLGLPIHLEVLAVEKLKKNENEEEETLESKIEHLMESEENLYDEIRELENIKMMEINGAEEEIMEIQEEVPVREEEEMLEEESMLLDQETEGLFDSREQDEEEAAFFAELASSARETERLKEQVYQAESELTELTEKYQKQKKQLKDLIQLLEQSKERQRADGQEILDVKRKVVHLETEVENLNQEIEEKDALVEEYQERCQEAESIKEQLSTSEQRRARAEEENSKLQEEIKEQHTEVERFRKTSEEHRAKAEKYFQAAEENRSLAEQLKEEVASARVEIENIKAENSRYKEEAETFRKRTEEYHQENTSLLDQIDHLKVQLEASLKDSSKEELERLKTEKEILEEDYQNRFRELQKEKKELERQYLEEVKKRRELLRRAKEEISKIKNQAQTSKKVFH